MLAVGGVEYPPDEGVQMKNSKGMRTTDKGASRLTRLAIMWAASVVVASVSFVGPSATASDTKRVGENTYDLTVNGKSKVLTEGETVTFPLNSAPATPANGSISPRVLYPGTGGSISVTASNGVYRWHVIASCATYFEGKFSITDLTSGLSGGFSTAIGLSGSVATSKLKGHRYSGTLSGVAFNFLVPCAWTGPNNTIYKY